ncbi:MAG: SURF1 family protein [Caldilineaceae bacterium]
MSEVLSVFKTMFNRRWWWKTLIVIAAMIFMAGLGNWQLQRLDQRRAYNAELLAKLASDPIVVDGGPLPEEPADLVDRRATVSGTYDFAGQISIKNQSHGAARRASGHAVSHRRQRSRHLINRGWVPYQQGTSALWGAVRRGGTGHARRLPTEIAECPTAHHRRQQDAAGSVVPAGHRGHPDADRRAHARLPGFGAGGRASVDGAAGAHPAGDGYQRGQSHELRHPVVFFRPHRRDRLLRCRTSSRTRRLNPSPTVDTEDTNTENPVAL